MAVFVVDTISKCGIGSDGVLLSFLFAVLSTAAVISLSAPVLICCFRALLYFFAISFKGLPGHSVDVDSPHISNAQNFISHEWAVGGSHTQSQLTVDYVFWNANILHTANMTQPPQSALSKQSVHTGKTRTRHGIRALVTSSCQDVPRIRRMLLRWNVLSFLSCPAYVVHFSLPMCWLHRHCRMPYLSSLTDWGVSTLEP